jgi:2-dehydropantoate 2-reductase
VPYRRTVAVIGMGGIGGSIAACLRLAGRHNVVACARRPMSALTFEHEAGVKQLFIHTLTDPAEARPVDWVMLCTKAQDTEGAFPWLQRLCWAGTRVAILQNGIGQADRVAPLIGKADAVPTIVHFSGERAAPDRVRFRHTQEYDLTVRDDPAGAAFLDVFGGTFLKLRASADFKTLQWRKLLLNAAANPITTLTRQRLGVLHRDDVRNLTISVLEEGAAVARADGARFEDEEPSAILKNLLNYPTDVTTSMYFDTLAGRPLEVEALTGAIVEAGRRHGVPTPVNLAIYALLSAISDAAEVEKMPAAAQ